MIVLAIALWMSLVLNLYLTLALYGAWSKHNHIQNYPPEGLDDE